MHRSRRVPENLAPTRLSRHLAAASAVDLTDGNPARCGFDLAGLEDALAAAATVEYDPQALGGTAAREAVARYVQPWMPGVGAGRVVLCASTSEAYSWCFKVLCDAGDSVAVPTPSYPLFDVLADLECVRLLPYRLVYDGGWRVDRDSLVAALSAGARAVVVVQPNNPTGSILTEADITDLRTRCARYGAVVISDEVFGPYGNDGRRLPTLGQAGDGPLTVVLDGLSKAAALPGAKLSWLVLSGEGASELLPRLEWVADAYLSASTLVQQALPRLLSLAPAIQKQISERVRHNRHQLSTALAAVPHVDLLTSDGGWYAVVRVPRVSTDDELVTRLAERAQVATQPGYFYDFEGEGYLVMSLLPPRDLLAAASARLVSELGRL